MKKIGSILSVILKKFGFGYQVGHSLLDTHTDPLQEKKQTCIFSE
jgi:hypothetical protein